MRLSRNGLGDNEGEPSCAGSVRGPPTAAHRATTLAAGLLQMATWDEMKEYGVDQNTISYNSLLSRWQLASSWQCRTRHSWLRGVTHHRASPHGPVPEHFGAASAPSCCGRQVTHQRAPPSRRITEYAQQHLMRGATNPRRCARCQKFERAQVLQRCAAWVWPLSRGLWQRALDTVRRLMPVTSRAVSCCFPRP